jgi:hypothetical protein
MKKPSWMSPGHSPFNQPQRGATEAARSRHANSCRVWGDIMSGLEEAMTACTTPSPDDIRSMSISNLIVLLHKARLSFTASGNMR